MIKLENVEVVGWEHAIRGMRNPMNSWEKSDSIFSKSNHDGTFSWFDACGNALPPCACAELGEVKENNRTGLLYTIAPNDHTLMMNLAHGGPVHAKYRRMITVYLDITAPLYWWKEFDTYRVGVEKNSCSTMHKIHAKEFTLEDFSCEHLMYDTDVCWEEDAMAGSECRSTPLDILSDVIHALNIYREKYLETMSKPMKDNTKRSEVAKKYWWQMIQLLPTSYNQKRTVMLNYEVLAAMYESRKSHKLDCWREFCKWIESLPYSEIITGEINKED